MEEDWKTYELQEIATIQTGPFGSQLHSKDYVVKGTPIITVEHLGENRITYQNLPQVSKEDKARLSKYHLKEGDVVFSRVGSVDRRALVTNREDGWLFSGRCLRVRADKSKASGPFLSYYFGLESFKDYIRRIAVGATMPSINTSILSGVEISVPPLPEQHAIASILSVLDDKIELNLLMNKILEEMTMALYKHWFVDFGPFKDGEFVSSELGEIPKGWEVRSIEDLCQMVGMGPFGSNIKVSSFVGSGVPIISGQHLRSLLVQDSQGHNFISEEHSRKLRNSIVFPGDVIFTHAGNIGQVAMLTNANLYNSYVLSQRQFFCRANTSKILPELIVQYFKTEIGINELLKHSSSSGVPSISRPVTNLRLVRLITPPLEIQKKYELIIGPIFKQIQSNEFENQTLTTLRDTLLPKLISGEVRVKDAARSVAEVL